MKKNTYAAKKWIILIVALLFVSSCQEEQDPCNSDSSSTTQSSSDSLSTDENCDVDPDPEPEPEPEPTPSPAPTPTPSPTPSPSPEVGSVDQLSEYIIDVVDDRRNNDELGKFRRRESFSRGDDCHDDLANKTRFGDAIAYFINDLTVPRKVQVQPISSFYGMQSTDANYEPISFFSHPMCRVTASTLGQTIKDPPGPITIGLAQRFSDEFNSYRTRYLSGDKAAKFDMMKLWGKFYGCLAYTESLGTADTSTSNRVAEKYAASNYRKPAGVKFYEDPFQNDASRLNIGMFQFTPTYTGNIIPCIRQWEKSYGCEFKRGNQQQTIPYVGSSLQHFNAFCGVHKIHQTWAIQVNSVKQRNTHPDNHRGSGNKSPKNRCVTVHFHSGWAYNHYGPLQNNTGRNMNELYRCIYPKE